MSQRMDYKEASPMGIAALAAVHGYIRRAGLPARLVNLVFLRVSQINGCAYCIDLHSHDLLAGGLPVEHLILVPVWREAGGVFNEEERAALAWAEALTRLGDGGISDNAFAAVDAIFDPKPLADLTIAIGLMNAYNRISIAFRGTPNTLAEVMNRSKGISATPGA